jgi:hypothetical protein
MLQARLQLQEWGKSREGRWQASSRRQDTRWQGKARVDEVESVTVPAETFQAFRMEFEGLYNGRARGGGNSWTGTSRKAVWHVCATDCSRPATDRG